MTRLQNEIYPLDPMFTSIAQARYGDEISQARMLYDVALLSSDEQLRAQAIAHLLSEKLRHERQSDGGIDSLLVQYPLDSDAGHALLNLVQAALRITDPGQLDRFIAEQLHQAAWHQQRGQSPSWLINLTTLGLDWADHLQTSASRTLIREAVKTVLHRLIAHFQIADNIAAALQQQDSQFRYCFATQGETALCEADALRNFERYQQTITAVGEYRRGDGQFGPSVSIKLSALHPKLSFQHYQQIHRELYPRLLQLALLAKQYDIGFTIDAEESAQQLLMLSLFERLMREADFHDWSGLGITLQAYLKNALHVAKWLSQYSKQCQRSICVRLVKGDYWESEIKAAQQAALSDYPVWTQKSHTDQCYLACAQVLLQADQRIYTQFATHNAFTLASIHLMAADKDCEFQALYGMGEVLYRLANELGIDRPCRLYAPIGSHHDLLPYLTRRFIENGASTSFLHQLQLKRSARAETPAKPVLPSQLFLPREISPALDLQHWPDFLVLSQEFENQKNTRYTAKHHANIYFHSNTQQKQCFNPANRDDLLGQVCAATASQIEHAFELASAEQNHWSGLTVAQRSERIEAWAQQLHAQQACLLNLLVREAGKTMGNAQQELRTAIDFCRYYAQQARQNWPSAPQPLGIVVTISPWHSPLAIFVGQICCALLAGNTVLAKPAAETPLIAAQAIACLHSAGVPAACAQLLLGDASVGAALTQDARCDAVMVSGTLATTQQIRRNLATLPTPRVLVAATGGINTLIADSSAQIEQLVKDVLLCAFDNAGQNCSALRLLCVQAEMADAVITRLKACMGELQMGNPAHFNTEVGPVIHAAAKEKIERAIIQFQKAGHTVFQTPLRDECIHGHYVAPTLIELEQIAQLSSEIFGPVLFIYRYQSEQLLPMLHEINHLASGQTMGIYSRIQSTIDLVIRETRIGSYYINRQQITSIVGCQPFGGVNSSGTGPLLGGPWTLWALCKDADPCLAIGQHDLPYLGALRKLALLWPHSAQRQALMQLLNTVAQRSLIGKSIDLPAIHGETNTLHYRARGRVACLGPTDWDLAQQIALALLTGNQVIVQPGSLTCLWENQLGCNAVSFASDPLQVPSDAVLCDQSMAAEIEATLAHSNGALRPLLCAFENGQWPIYRLIAEYTVTSDTI